jgi:hypothetical protein
VAEINQTHRQRQTDRQGKNTHGRKMRLGRTAYKQEREARVGKLPLAYVGLTRSDVAREGAGSWATRSRNSSSIFASMSSCAPRVFRRASQGPQGRVVPFGGARQGPIVGYVLQLAAPTGPSP